MNLLLTFICCSFINFCLVQQSKMDFSPICPEGDESNPIISNWQALGPFEDVPNLPQNIGLVACFLLHPTNSTVAFLGSNTGGMYKTENFTDSIPIWKNVTNSMRLPGMGISQIVINPKQQNILYASTGFSSGYGEGVSVGVIKSIDSGNSWFPVGPNFPADKSVPNRILIDKFNPKKLVFTSVDKIYVSLDEGKTWKLHFQLPNSKGLNKYHTNKITRAIVDLEQSNTDSKIWYVSTDYGGSVDSVDNCLVYKTVDGGNSWKLLAISKSIKADKLVLALSSIHPRQLWLTYSYKEKGKQLNKIMKSYDEGENWSVVSSVSISGTGYHRQDLELSPSDSNVIYVGGYYVNKSIDGGRTFQQLSKGLHLDTRYLKILKTTDLNDLVIVGNDGGIAISDDNFKTWKNKNGSGLNIKQFIGIGVGNRSENLIVGGTQDNDISIYDKKWQTPQLSNDGADGIVNNQNNSQIFAEPWCCDASQLKVRFYEKELDNWKIKGSIPPPEKEANNARPIEQFENGQLIIGHHDLWKSESSSLKWQKLTDFSSQFPLPKEAKINSLAIAKKDTTKIAVLYAGPSWSDELSETYLLVSKKVGKALEWTDLTPNLPKIVPRWIEMNCIAVDQNNERDLFIGMNFVFNSEDTLSQAYPKNGQCRVIRSTDFGQTWEDYSKNLPPFPVRDIVSEEGVNGGLYVATDAGVYYTNERVYDRHGWVCFNTNLPVGMVLDLEINYCQSKLVAGTFGHGVWVSDLAKGYANFIKKETIELKGKHIWEHNKDINQDIILKKNGKLIIKNASISMAKESVFVLEEGAELILDNSKLGCFCGEKWRGVQYLSKKTRRHKKISKGKLTLLNQSEVIQ